MATSDLLTKLKTDITNSYNALNVDELVEVDKKNTDTLTTAISSAIDTYKSYLPTATSTGDIEDALPLKAEYNIYGNVRQGLPSEYQEVEYIESTGTQYIDTGIIPDNNTRLESKVLINSDSPLQYGTRSNNSDNIWFLFGTDANKKIIAYVGDSSSGNYTYNDKLAHEYVLDAKNNYVSVDKAIQKTTGKTIDINNPILLFTRISYNNGNSRCYYNKIYKNDMLIQNLIPCYRKSDNVAGMYDLVNDVFYTNQGTGDDFTVGADVTEPTPDYPQEIEVIKDTLVLNNSDDNGNTSQIQIPLGDNYLAKVGDKRDILSISSKGKATKENKINHIASYNGETITGDYISTTGELTTGAEVYYVADTSTEIDLGTIDTSKLFAGVNHLTLDSNLDTDIEVTYYEDKR